MAVFPENGAAAIAALDSAIEIVPLVDPPYRSEGRLLLIEVPHRVAKSDLPQKRECAVQDTAIVGRGDNGVAGGAGPQGLQPISVRPQVGGGIELRKGLPNRAQRAEYDGGFTRHSGLHPQRPAEHAADAEEQFPPCALEGSGVAQADDHRRYGLAVLPGRAVAQRRVSQPGGAVGFGVKAAGRQQAQECPIQVALHVSKESAPAGRLSDRPTGRWGQLGSSRAAPDPGRMDSSPAAGRVRCTGGACRGRA